ncbi:ABC transporter permease, partial [candidate division WOR-3 bacterium]|nr:ABC transporter permease [candidate division WOR-3 bacterium]
MIELLIESLRVSLDSVKANKLRSFLTTLGIIIGVMTIIIVVSIIDGLESQVMSTFSSLGTNVIYVQRRGWIMRGGADWRKTKSNYVDMNDYYKMQDLSTTAEEIGVSISNYKNIKYINEKLEMINIDGISASYMKIRNYEVDVGLTLSDNDIKMKNNVCLIGKDISDNLFFGANPIGKWLTIDGNKFLIKGILTEKGSFFGQSQDEIVLIPYTVMLKYYPTEKRHITILLSSNDPEETIEEARWVMRISHSLKPGEEDDFSINTQYALMEQWK